MKKLVAAVTSILLLFSWLLPSAGFAEQYDGPFVIEGKVENGRTLVPVRGVSAGLGAEVVWNQQSKTVTVLQGDKSIVLTVGSKQATLNGKAFAIDVPPKIEKGVTYVPIRFISQALGGTVSWDASSSTADIELNGKRVRITTEATFNHSELSQERIEALILKANEAADLSSYPQIRTHFRPYFTDVYMNKLIREKGLQVQYPYTEIAYSYSSGTEGYISQTSTQADLTVFAVERKLYLKLVEGNWMVDDIVFTVLYP